MTRSPAARRVVPIGRTPGCEALECRRLFAAGGLDASFGGDGDASASVPGLSLTGRAVAVQADGKTVVVGSHGSIDGFAVTRYNLNGTPDTTFGPDHNGTVITRAGSSGATAVGIQPDGKIVVTGYSDLSDTRVIRLNPDGSFDRTFGGGDGSVTFDPVGIGDIATYDEMILLPDGKILLGGDGSFGIISSDFDLVFARLNPDGSFDDSFDGDGKKSLGFGTNERFADMAVDYSGSPATNPDYGKVVVAGYRFGDRSTTVTLLMTRLNTNGSHDTTYNGDGSGQVRFPDAMQTDPVGVVIQDSGRIVVGGYVDDTDFMLAGFRHDGALDDTFGPNQNGWVSTDLGGRDPDIATDLIMAPSGGLILAGYSVVPVLGGRENRSAIAYYTPDGRPDTRFGGDGMITYGFGGELKRLAAGPGRRFVFAGGGGMHAARFLDVGANVVYAATLNPVISEAGPSRGFFVYRTERVPFATRVYFNVGGGAYAPTGRALSQGFHDYVTDGLVFPNPGTPYADIPADQTFALVTITPRQDRESEGNESAEFTILANPAYEVGDPNSVRMVIVDDDAPPPTVTEVYVRGSAWKGTDGDALNTTFKEHLGSAALGNAEYGYRVDTLPAGTTLPWTNANELVVRYSAPPTGGGIPTTGGVALVGARPNSDYSVTAVTPMDAQTYLLALDRPLGSLPGGGIDGNRVLLSVAGGGDRGSAYMLTLNPLQGDADRLAARVSATDLAYVKGRLNRTATEGGTYSPFADANADGRINSLDLAAVKGRLNDTLPPASLAASAGAPLTTDRRLWSVLALTPEGVLA